MLSSPYGTGAGRASVLLAASLAFHLWSGPLFVPVVVVTWLGYGFSKRTAAGSHKRLWLILGVLMNVGVLACYKYTRFAVDNLDVLLVHAGLQPWHVGQRDDGSSIGIGF